VLQSNLLLVDRTQEVKSMMTTIERATTEDGPHILRLLTNSALPVDGLLEHIDTATVARLDGQLVGCAALELYREGALLRSVAVDPALRGNGIGIRLIQSVLAEAQRLGVRDVYLLTTTAEQFFVRFGFTTVDRIEVPLSLRESVEFRSACPASATVMRCRRYP
jgi:amino-acid N-acetyltransferase